MSVLRPSRLRRRQGLPQSAVARRTLLKALGLGGASLLLPSLDPRLAHADQLGAVRRVVFFVTSHGTVYPNWRMRPEGQPDDQDWEFDLAALSPDDFSPILAPLAPLRDKLLVLDGLANATGRTAAFNEHEMGHASCMTGRIPIEGNGQLGAPDGPSIDQVIAAGVEDPGVFLSLEYGIGGWPVCFDTLGQAVPYEMDVWEAYDRLFPGGQPDPDAEPTTEQRIAAGQPSMLDFVGGRYEAMFPRLSGADRMKVEQHRDLLRQLETTLEGLADLECEVPPPPMGAPGWGESDYPQWHEDVFFQLTSLALSCNMSKVVTIRHDQIFNSTIGAPAGDIHNDFAHQAESEPDAASTMTDYHVHQANAFYRLIEALDQIPELDGTMLDHTVVVWHNELSTGSHSMTDLPIVVAGGGGYFDLGRYVRWRASDVLQGPWSEVPVGPAHNKFLTSLARSMGLGLDAFGHPEVPRAGGGMISTTGLLDRICV